jgi:protein phosphatase 1 regulatory subunit 37
MIRDYPDVVPAGLASPPSTASSSTTSSPTSSFTNLPAVLSPPISPASASSTGSFIPTLTNAIGNANAGAIHSPVAKANPILPPPRHPPSGLQTTYTPYVPRARRQPAASVPIITSSSRGGVTTRHAVSDHSNHASKGSVRHDAGPSAALLDKVRALDALPRIGALRTLDLRGNDLRVGTLLFVLPPSAYFLPRHPDGFFVWL